MQKRYIGLVAMRITSRFAICNRRLWTVIDIVYSLFFNNSRHAGA